MKRNLLHGTTHGCPNGYPSSLGTPLDAACPSRRKRAIVCCPAREDGWGGSVRRATQNQRTPARNPTEGERWSGSPPLGPARLSCHLSRPSHVSDPHLAPRLA
jgi:hypothetical protein